MTGKIILLSGPVQSGKTSALMKLLKIPDSNIGGFITPDRHGSRILLNPENGQEMRFQAASEIPEADVVSVGRFRFFADSFEKAEKWTTDQVRKGLPLIIMDEIGKLELKEQGFHRLITTLLSEQQKDQKYLFIIRDYLMDEVIKKYKLEYASVITIQELKTVLLGQ
jgi:nucleoside-triphosphatase